MSFKVGDRVVATYGVAAGRKGIVKELVPKTWGEFVRVKFQHEGGVLRMKNADNLVLAIPTHLLMDKGL